MALMMMTMIKKKKTNIEGNTSFVVSNIRTCYFHLLYQQLDMGKSNGVHSSFGLTCIERSEVIKSLEYRIRKHCRLVTGMPFDITMIFFCQIV
jgi:hypothetical protein